MAGGKHILGMPQGKHIFGTVKVGDKGQIVIPRDARTQFHISPGDTLLILGDDQNGIFISRPDIVNEMAMKIFEKVEEKEK